MIVPAEFNDIRPYNPDEIPSAVQSLASDPMFCALVAQQMPGIPVEAIMAKAAACTSLLDFQLKFSYPLMARLIDTLSDGTDMEASHLDKSMRYTFVTNHRDIVLDSGFLSKLLIDQQFPTTVEIAIGDNLLSLPWIRTLVRLNKSFIVQRSLHGRDKLMASQQLGRYMNFAINQKQENIWIAQRQGRAKDSNDLTQESVLKMMAYGGTGTVMERLAQLNIVPMSISYEYDPCDYLKAQEFQQRRDNPDFQKTREEDVVSMQVGITGYKGHIHYHAAACISPWLRSLNVDLPRNEIYPIVANHINHEIHRNYRLYANNYIAFDRINHSDRFAALYTKEEEARFDKYIQGQLDKVTLANRDLDFLTQQLYLMYANPLANYLKAAEE